LSPRPDQLPIGFHITTARRASAGLEPQPVTNGAAAKITSRSPRRNSELRVLNVECVKSLRAVFRASSPRVARRWLRRSRLLNARCLLPNAFGGRIIRARSYCGGRDVQTAGRHSGPDRAGAAAVYRGPAAAAFDPERIRDGRRWQVEVKATFTRAGEYTLRAFASDGRLARRRISP
jgi:hypothetical protein